MAQDSKPVNDRPEWFWEIALAVNAAFKGLLGSQGESGHICAKTIPILIRLDLSTGWDAFVSTLCIECAPHLQQGDVLVLADKVVAAALNRVGPRSVISERDPKTVPAADLSEMAKYWGSQLGFPIQPVHLLLADEYETDRVTLGADDHNRRVAEIAAAIRAHSGLVIDVVISDTDTGLDTRSPLIGTLTICATPLGATAGLNLYEAMRCAVAAEFTRGHTKNCPFVVCVPAERRRLRRHMGAPRSYSGLLDRSREAQIAHA